MQEKNYLHGQVKSKLNDDDSAIDYYIHSRNSAGIKRNDLYYLATLELGKLSVKFGNKIHAEEYFEEILKKHDERELKTKAYAGLAQLYYFCYENNALITLLSRWEKDLDTLEETALRNYYKAQYFLRENNEFDAYVLLMQALNYATDVDINNDIYGSLAKLETNKKKQNYYITMIKQKAYSDLVKLEIKKKDGHSQELIKLFNDYLVTYPDVEYGDYVCLMLAEILYSNDRINDALLYFNKYLNEQNKQYDLELFYRANYGLGLVYLKKREYLKAFELFAKLKRTDVVPQMRATTMLYATQKHEEEERFDEAMRIYKEIYDEDFALEYKDYVLLKMTYISLQIQDYAQALKYSHLLDEMFPEHPYREDNLYYRALAYFEQGDYVLVDEIINSFNELFDSSEYSFDLLKLQLRTKAAIEELELDSIQNFYKDVLKANANSMRINEIKFEQALGYLSRYEFDAAIEILTILVNSDNVAVVDITESALYYLAQAYYQNGNLSAAILSYENLLSRFDQGQYAGSARFDLAQLYLYNDEYDKAESTLFKNIRTRMEDIVFDSANILKDLQIRQLRYASAQQLFDQLSQRFPHRAAFCLAQKVDIAFAQGEWLSVIVLGRKALESGYESDELFFQIAQAYERNLDYDKAIKAYKDLVFVNSTSKEYVIKGYLHLARLYEQTGQRKKAGDIYERLLGLQVPESVFAVEQLERLKKSNSSS